MSQRLVLVDDTNPNIQYSGPWFSTQNTQLNTGDFGTPFQNTLHGVNVDANFSYSFNGSSVTVLGTSTVPDTNFLSGPDLSWECFVDNSSIGSLPVISYAENNWVFCQNGQLQDGPHVLTVKAKVSNQKTFWFDQIQYLPSSNVSLDESIVRINSNDPDIQYSSGWKELNGVVNLTQTTGSTITYVFTGVSLSFVSFLPDKFPLTPSSTTYSIDGKAPASFLVPIGSPELYNQFLFQTGQLSAGQHKLVVTHQGNNGSAPLVLDYLVVQNAPSTSTSSAPTGATSTASVPTSNIGHKKSPPIGIIIGVVCGVIVLVLLLLYIRRRNNRKKRRLSETSYLPIDVHVVYPFTESLHPQNTSEGQSLTSRPFAKGGQASDSPQSTSINMRPTSPSVDAPFSGPSGGMSASIPLAFRNHRSSPLAEITSPLASLVRARTHRIDAASRDAEMMIPLLRRSASLQGSDTGLLRHEDSGFRLSFIQDSLIDLPPPMYTTH
ncbi:hypothetical protein BYT27DRAFT_7337775 [Phlegmacium glaucopus]|nr:hypothetical protein BYT27DRAFT_7337775 [Phlegmacium glaucopus]